MKNIFLLLFGFFTFGATSQIEVSNTQYSFGGGLLDEIKDVRRVSDGYLILLNSSSGVNGNKTVAGYGDEDFWLVKTDFNLNIQWQEVYGGSLQDRPYDILELSDGNFLLTGLSFSGVSGNKTTPNNGDEDFFCVKVDNGGNILWDLSLGGDSTDIAFSSIELNNEIYIVGQTFSGISGNKTSSIKAKSDCWVVKLDLAGNKIWEKTIGGDEFENVPTVTSIGNKLFIACQSNSTASFDKSITNYGDVDSWVITLDTSGSITNQNVFGGDTYDANPYIVSDGANLLLASTSFSGISGNKTSSSYGVVDYWLLKLDSSLNIIFDYSFGGDDADECYGVSVLNNGDYTIHGRSRSNISGIKTSDNFDQIGTPIPTYDIWFMGIDSDGNLLWQSTFGGTENDNPVSVIEDPNHTLNIFGYSSSNTDGNKTATQYGSGDGWVIKLETNLSIEEQNFNDFISIYPNPSNGIININFENNNDDFKVVIYNSIGQLKDNFELKGNFNNLDLSSYESGMYFLDIVLKGNVLSKKFVKQ